MTGGVRVTVLGGGPPLLHAGIEAALTGDSRLKCHFEPRQTSPTLGDGHSDVADARVNCDVAIMPADAPSAELAAVLRWYAEVAPLAPLPKLMVLTAHWEVDELVGCIRLGADGYGLLSELWPEDLREAVVTLAKEGTWVCPATTRRLIELVRQSAALPVHSAGGQAGNHAENDAGNHAEDHAASHVGNLVGSLAGGHFERNDLAHNGSAPAIDVLESHGFAGNGTATDRNGVSAGPRTHVLGAGSAGTPDPSRAIAFSVSERELEVLRLFSTGAGEQHIADTLHLTRNTVKTYLKRICEKLGAGSRAEALRVAVQRGLIPDRRGR